MKTLSTFVAFIYYVLSLFGLSYGQSDIIYTPDCTFTVESQTDLFYPSDEVWVNGAEYPTVIELNHNGENNGTLLASFEVFDKGETKFRIMKSTDKGDSWTEIAVVKETLDSSLMAAWEPCLFELPEAMGSFPEGTVILGGISLDDGCKSKTKLCIWTSTDCGNIWTETSVADEAGGSGEGIWEPYFVYEDCTLYCFYSDDSDPVHSQTIVYKSTKDLINWSEKVPVVVFANPDARPGMPVVTKMDNGRYYLCYELLENGDNKPCRYKISDSISEWDACDEGTEIIAGLNKEIHTSPVCLWIPQGKNGTLIVAGKYGNCSNNQLFVSNDYGKTYTLMISPFEYDNSKAGFGYSPCLIYSETENAVYFANTVDYKDSLSKIQFIRMAVSQNSFSKFC